MRFLSEKRIILQLESRRDARVAEEARLESVYTSKAYPGFESPSLRFFFLFFDYEKSDCTVCNSLFPDICFVAGGHGPED